MLISTAVQLLFVVTCAYGARNFSIDFFPESLDSLVQGTTQIVLFNLSFLEENGLVIREISVVANNSNVKTAKIADFSNDKRFSVSPEGEFRQSGNFSVHGEFFGRSFINFTATLERVDWSQSVERESFSIDTRFEIIVLRAEGRLQPIFSGIITAMIAINTFVMGMQLDWRTILAILKKPIAPLLGFLCQFGVMPVVAFALGQALLPGEPNLQLGLFCVGCAPGGGNSNLWTILLGGNVDLSVTMTFVSTVAALGMMPLWLYTLGRYITRGSTIGGIPFDNILISLATLIIPCTLGIILKHFKPSIEEKSKLVVKILSVIIIIIALTFGVYVNYFIFLIIDWKSVVCGLLLPWCGFLIGFIVGRICRQPIKNALTIAIETGIQNVGIAIILITFSLKQPETDQTMVMPICVFMFTPIPLAILLAIKTVIDRRRKKSEAHDQKETTKPSRRGFVAQVKEKLLTFMQKRQLSDTATSTPGAEVSENRVPVVKPEIKPEESVTRL